MRTGFESFVMRTGFESFVMRTGFESFVMRTGCESFVMRTGFESFVMRTVGCRAPDGSSPRGCVRIIESDVDCELYDGLSCCSLVALDFVGCVAALPMGVAPESLGDRLRSVED